MNLFMNRFVIDEQSFSEPPILGLLFCFISDKKRLLLLKNIQYFYCHFIYLVFFGGSLINVGRWKKVFFLFRGGFNKWKWLLISAKFWSELWGILLRDVKYSNLMNKGKYDEHKHKYKIMLCFA